MQHKYALWAISKFIKMNLIRRCELGPLFIFCSLAQCAFKLWNTVKVLASGNDSCTKDSI